MSDTTMRGVTWNHPRGLLPLEAVSREFSETHMAVQIEWQVRSLADYEDQPIEELFNEYDLVVVNHPFIGDCAKQSLLMRLDEVLPSSFLAEQARGSVGPSFESYRADEELYALPVDAASIVSAYRPDILEELGYRPPTSFTEVIGLQKALHNHGKPPLASPLAPQHAYSAYLSLFANIAGPASWGPEGLEMEAACEALERLSELAAVLSPKCFELNPIHVLNAMANGEVSYIPYSYGYVNYVRPEPGAPRVAFADMPGLRGTPDGSLLGGVGIGISTATAHPHLAAEFVMTVTSPETQRHTYVRGSGQAGHRTAWTDPHVQADWPDFYDTTLRSLDSAFLRPRPAGFPDHQKRARSAVHRFLKDHDISAAQVVAQINQDYHRTVAQGEK